MFGVCFVLQFVNCKCHKGMLNGMAVRRKKGSGSDIIIVYFCLIFVGYNMNFNCNLHLLVNYLSNKQVEGINEGGMKRVKNKARYHAFAAKSKDKKIPFVCIVSLTVNLSLLHNLSSP